MPLLLKKTPTSHSRLGIWRIRERAEQLIEGIRLTPDEQKTFQQIKNEDRKTQWLCIRALLKELLEDNKAIISYDTYGKPYLEKSVYKISVSHSRHYAALI